LRLRHVLFLLMSAHSCWQCGQPDAGSLFCRFCSKLLAPNTDYFQFFDLPRHLDIDTAELQRRFYALSRLLHPDSYTRAGERERRYSLEATAILNDSYRTLRDPVLRAEYMLKENGLELGEQRGRDVPPELLEEVFEMNLALDELRQGDQEARASLGSSREHFQELQDAIDGELAGLFRRHDAEQTHAARRAVLEEIRARLNRRRYVRNLLLEVDKELAASG
jgi:molecular chaperone HscB